MPKKKTTHITRKLTRQRAHSYYIIIPPALIHALGWRERQKLIIERDRKTIRIRDWKQKRKK